MAAVATAAQVAAKPRIAEMRVQSAMSALRHPDTITPKREEYSSHSTSCVSKRSQLCGRFEMCSVVYIRGNLEIFMEAGAHPSGAGACDGHKRATSLERRGIVQVPHATPSTACLCDPRVRHSPTAGTVVFTFAKRESSPG